MKNALFGISIFLFVSCATEVVETASVYTVPSNLGSELPTSDRNPMSKEGVFLGKKLFFDPALSKNGKIACANCHIPEKAFTDGLSLSDKGVSGNKLHRNAPTLTNIAWVDGLFWDGGALNLESLAFGPLTHADEMAADLKELVKRLEKDAVYKPLFGQAFPDLGVSSSSIARALAQYQRTLISGGSAYDLYARGNKKALTQVQQKGMLLFEANCSSCHATDHFTDFGYHNNGLDSIFQDEAFERIFQGRYRITLNTADLGKFKTPTLRNVALTAPYMHDGRFGTLDEVMEHYATGVKNSNTLDLALQRGAATGFHFSEAEKAQLIAFLHSLTDYDFIETHKLQE